MLQHGFTHGQSHLESRWQKMADLLGGVTPASCLATLRWRADRLHSAWGGAASAGALLAGAGVQTRWTWTFKAQPKSRRLCARPRKRGTWSRWCTSSTRHKPTDCDVVRRDVVWWQKHDAELPGEQEGLEAGSRRRQFARRSSLVARSRAAKCFRLASGAWGRGLAPEGGGAAPSAPRATAAEAAASSTASAATAAGARACSQSCTAKAASRVRLGRKARRGYSSPEASSPCPAFLGEGHRRQGASCLTLSSMACLRV